MMAKDTGVPGNTWMEQAAFDRMVYDVGKSLMQLAESLSKMNSGTERLVALKLRAPKGPGGEWLAVVSTLVDDERFVAFSSGVDFVVCLQTLGARLRNGSLKWKEDQYG